MAATWAVDVQKSHDGQVVVVLTRTEGESVRTVTVEGLPDARAIAGAGLDALKAEDAKRCVEGAALAKLKADILTELRAANLEEVR